MKKSPRGVDVRGWEQSGDCQRGVAPLNVIPFEKFCRPSKDTFMLFYFSDYVNRFFLDTYNRIHGTAFDVNNVSREIWRSVHGFMRMSKYCPSVEITGRKSRIEMWRKSAANGELPTDVREGGVERKKEGGDSKNITEGGKGTGNRYKCVQNGKDEVPVAREGDLGGFEMVRLDYMRSVCRVATENAVYTYKSARTGKDLEFRGSGWRSKRENRRSGNAFRRSYEKIAPFMREALFVTLKSPFEGHGLALKEEAEGFFAEVKGLRQELVKRMGLAVFSVYEYAMGTGLHCHMVVMTGEEFPDFRGKLSYYIEKNGFEGFADLREWNIEGGCEYLLKTLSTGTDELHAKFQGGGYMPSVQEEEAFVIWDVCRHVKVRQVSFPKVGKMEERKEEIVQNAENPRVYGSEPVEKIAKAVASAENGGISRAQARKMFKNEKCWHCKLECGVAQWLKECVKPSNPLLYMDLGDFLRKTSAQ